MKRIVALLLALVMVFAFVSCGGKTPCETCVDEDGDLVCDVCGEEIKPDSGEQTPGKNTLTVADFAKILEATPVSRIEMSVKEDWKNVGSLKSTYTIAFGQGDTADISYKRQTFDVSEDVFETDTPAIKEISGTVKYKNGAYTGSMEGTADAVAKLALKLSADKLANVTVSGTAKDGAILTAMVLKTDAKAVFGVELPSNATLSVTLAKGAKSVSAFTLSYSDGDIDVEFAAQYK
jgi:uncharacterized protein with FMN-binding domain/predicted small lipoprotein YifL